MIHNTSNNPLTYFHFSPSAAPSLLCFRSQTMCQAAEAAHAETLRVNGQQESRLQVLEAQVAAYEEQLGQWKVKTATAEDQVLCLNISFSIYPTSIFLNLCGAVAKWA